MVNPSVHYPGSNQVQLTTGEQTAVRQENSSLPILKEWGEQHKVKKHEGIGFIAHLVRKVGLIASVVFAIPVGLVMGAYNLASSIREKYIINHKPNHVLPAIREMKQKEEADKLDTMKQVLSDPRFGGLNDLTAAEGARELTKDLAAKLQDPAVKQNKLGRFILRELSRQDGFNSAWIQILKDPAVMESLMHKPEESIADAFRAVIGERYPQQLGDIANLDWTKINAKIEKGVLPQDSIDKEVARFERSLKELLTILKQPSSDPASTNPQFIKAFRKALNSPVYQALKEDASNPSTQLLHRFASDMWNKAPSMDAYQALGTNIIGQMGEQTEGQPLNGEQIAERLEHSHSQMEKLHYSAHGMGVISYSLTHPIQTLGALASEGGAARHIPGMFNMDEYDSHGTLANNPSLQGVTTVNWEANNGRECQVDLHNCYGGSPTIGDHKIAPEFEAVILAAENNQMAPEELRDPSIPMMVNYNNLQNLDKVHGEGPRSRTIMLLNQKYPLSFRGTTFAKDSSFYMMPTPESVVWTTPREFGDKMLGQLLKSFDKGATGHGFYFHGSIDKWQPIFEEVLKNTTAHFEHFRETDPVAYGAMTPRELQGAYQEYAYSMLNSVIEMEAIKTVSGRGIDRCTIMTISACKENIDRGGMENTKYLYTRLPETDERLPLLMGAMHSRALSARDRIILKSRMPQILNFMETTSAEVFRNNQMNLFRELGYGIQTATFRPSITAAA